MLPDPVGQRFGLWTVIAPFFVKGARKYKHVVACCDCGNIRDVNWYSLVTGRSTRCLSCALTTHGSTISRAPTPEYVAWGNMLQRCYNPKNNNYSRYGALGVTVCDRWNPRKGGSFENFLKDVGPRPTRTHQLDKEAGVPGGTEYGPGTTQWSTKRQNNRNKRTNVIIEYNNQKLSLIEWAETTGISYRALQHRFARGWTIERALTTPRQR